MSHYLFLPPFLYIAALVDTSFGPALELGGVAPDALALVAIVWSLVASSQRGPLAAGAAGFASDLVSTGRLGTGLFCFALAGYALSELRARFGIRRSLALSLCAWPAATFMVLGPAVMRRALGEVDVDWTMLVCRGLEVSAYTAAAVTPVLFAVAAARRIGRQRRWV
jgi:rod shape-determining protein MreD